jgi:hypothetical protein
MQLVRSLRWSALLVAFGTCLFHVSPARAQDLTGHWSGHWEDCRSGHSGPLRGTFCKCDDNHYRVTFSGRFFAVMPFRYTVVLTVVGREGDKVLLAGESDLGPLFGTFTYRGEATDCHFVADYCARRYQGKFVLDRCCR